MKKLLKAKIKEHNPNGGLDKRLTCNLSSSIICLGHKHKVSNQEA